MGHLTFSTISYVRFRRLSGVRRTGNVRPCDGVTLSTSRLEGCKHDAHSRSHRPSGWPAILDLSHPVYHRSQKVGVWIRIRFRGLPATWAISGRTRYRHDFPTPRTVSACY